MTFLHLNWGVSTIQSSKVPTNFYSSGSHNFCSTLTFLHLNWVVPTTQGLKIPTNFYSADFYSAGSHNFYSTDFYSTVTFLHLNSGVPITQSPKVPPIFVPLGHTIFIPLIFILMWPFCTQNWLEGPRHLATSYIMHTNILNIPNPNWSQYQVSPPPARKIHLFGGVLFRSRNSTT